MNAEDRADVEALFVQSAARFRSGDGAATLLGLTPATLYIADHPRRELGHLTNRNFVDLWSEGDSSFASDPPKAIMSFLEHGDDTSEEVVVILRDPILTGDVLTYKVALLGGELPASAGTCSIFIDAFGRLLSPASLARIRRRERRQVSRGDDAGRTRPG